MSLATEKGREYALAKLKERRANPPERINNSALPAFSSMYFYCHSCGAISDILPENYLTTPSHICTECAAMKNLGWLE